MTSRRSQLNRASLGTAAGTLASRVTGLVRLVVLAYAIGGSHVGDAFNLANNTPNMIHDLVLGGILAATFVPVVINRLTSCSASEAADSISVLVSFSILVLVLSTIVFELIAPTIVSAYTFGAHIAPSERTLAVVLLRLFAPQVLCYGAFGLIAGLLATKDKFAIVGFAPIWNNLVGIGIMLAFAIIAGRAPTVSSLSHDSTLVYFLGAGTTIAVASQALALIPALRRSGIKIRFKIRLGDPAVKMMAMLSGWTLGFVLANQLAVFVILALEVRSGTGGVSAYTYAFTFFQLPFGVIAVSIINVMSPDLARAYSNGRLADLGKRFGNGARQVLALIMPASVGYLILARPIVDLLIGHGAESSSASQLTAATLVMFALGLPGFCIFFLVIRAFQAMHDTRTAFILYVIENATNILIAFALYKSYGVRGLALSYSIAYTMAAIVALALLKERIGSIGGRALVTGGIRAIILSLIMAVVVALVVAVVGQGRGLIGWIHLFIAVAAGAVVYLGGAGLAGTIRNWHNARHATALPPSTKR